MVLTRSQRIAEEATVEDTIDQNAEWRHAFLTLRFPKPVHTSATRRITRRQAASSSTTQKTIAGRITKQTSLLEYNITRKVRRVILTNTEVVVQQAQDSDRRATKRVSRSLKVKLCNINYAKLPPAIQKLDYKIVRHEQRRAKYTGHYLPPPLQQYNNRYQFMFGHDPFRHVNFQGPTEQQQWQVYELMKQDLKDNFNKECFLDQPDASTNDLQGGPMHMSDELTVDNLVKVILSISTENSLAIRQHAQLCSKFTYTVGGKEVKGTVPNYHKMRVCPPNELVKALNIAGYQNMRQKAFQTILQEIYNHNVELMAPYEVVPDGNPAEVADFVPGLLSMEYLKVDGLSKQERFDLLVKFDQIAVKTGCCLLTFNLKIPIFVVDTHVHHMTRNLQWIPENCWDADKACMFLDTIMPNQLKFGLHQAFWHHRINCARCMPRANPKSLAYQQRICPLEGLIKRDLPPLGRSTARDSQAKKSSKAAARAPTVSKEKKPAGSLAFLRIHYKIAEERGYALRKVEIDDNFGDGARQNKDKTASFYWGRRELAHANDIVRFEDALEAVGISMEVYEARFVKKTRIGAKKEAMKKETMEDIKHELDLSSDSDLTDLDDLQYESLSEYEMMGIDNEL